MTQKAFLYNFKWVIDLKNDKEVPLYLITKKILWVVEGRCETDREKNKFSLLFMFWFCNFIIMMIAALLPFIRSVMDWLRLPIEMIILQMNLSIGYSVVINEQFLREQFSLTNLFDWRVIIIPLISMIPVFYSFFKSNGKVLKTLTAVILLQIIATMIFIEGALLAQMIFAIVFGVLLFFKPLDDGNYYSLLKQSQYFYELYFEEKSKYKFQLTIKKILIVLGFFVGGVVFSLILSNQILNMTFYLAVVIYIVLLILLWMTSAKNKTSSILRKFISYFLVLLFVLFQNNLIENMIGLVLSVIAVLFAFQRLFAVFSEAEKLITTKSLFHLLDEKNEQEALLQEKLDISSDIDNLVLKEDIFLRQIVIYMKLGKKETKKLISRYRELGYAENKLIKWFEFLMSDISERNLEEVKNSLFEIRQDTTFGTILALEFEYATFLFLLQENTKEIVEILSEHTFYLTEKLQYILLYSLKCENMEKQAGILRKVIPNYDDEKVDYEKIKSMNAE